MRDLAFWAFFVFGAGTVLLAVGGGGFAFFGKGTFHFNAVGFLLLFLGASLAVMLASLLFIQVKQGKLQKPGRSR